jgi:cyclopropane-fatty-acyl-phospholipid synthase
VGRLEDHHDEAARIAGEKNYRVWRLYMSGSARAFATGRIGVIQTLFSKNNGAGLSRLPLTREDLYVRR